MTMNKPDWIKGGRGIVFLLALSFSLTACGNDTPESSVVVSSVVSEITEDNETIIDVAEETEEKEARVSITECELPQAEFQKTYCFPDWLTEVNNSTVMNSIGDFIGFEDQGVLYVTVKEGVDSFSMFINSIPVDTGYFSAGNTYKVDFSEISLNRVNNVNVCNIKPYDLEEAVTVNITYPTVIETSETLINPDAFLLIEDIINTDIEYGFSTASVTVIKDGKLVYNKAFGKVNPYNADLSPNTASKDVSEDCLFDLASNTKMYSVIYAIQYLVSKGELSLEDKISDILGPEFYENTINIDYRGYNNPGLKVIKEWKKNITVRDVCCHRAGFNADPKYEISTLNASTGEIDVSKVNPLFSGNDHSLETRGLTYDCILKTPLMYEPGTKTLYSDTDYMLLCFLIEKVTGKRIDDFLSEIFFEPMGLSHITYNPLENGFSKDDCVATELQGNTREGHVYFDNIRTETIQGDVHDEKAYYSMAGISGHAGLFSNGEDLSKLAFVMLSGGYGENSYFSQDVIDTFTAPTDLLNTDWGTGWWRNGDDGRAWYFGTDSSNNSFGHQGWTGTLTVIDPDNSLVIVYLTNRVGTPLKKERTGLNDFTGNAYTAGSLGFATEIIYEGLKNPEGDMTEYFANIAANNLLESLRLIPKKATLEGAYFQNARSKRDVLLKWTEKVDTPKFRELSLYCVDCFEEKEKNY